MTSPNDNEVGARLSLSGQQKFHADAQAAAKDMDALGTSTKEAGDKAEKSGGKFTSMGDRVKKAGGVATAAGKTLSKGLTLPIIAVGTMAVKAALDVDEAYDTIRIGTGATGAQLDSLQDSFDSIAKAIPASFEDISGSISIMNTILGNTGDNLESLVSKTLEASRMLGEDGVANVDAFSRALNAWGIPAEQGEDVIETLFKATQDYGVSLNGLLGNLKAFGPQMSAMGLDMKQTISFFGQMNKAGVNTTRIIPSLNTAMLKWTKEGLNASDMLADVTKQIAGATSQQEAMSIATQHFAGPGAAQLVKALREGGVSLADLGNEFTNLDGNIMQTAADTDDFPEVFQRLKNQATLALSTIGEKLFPILSDALEKAIPMLEAVVDWFSNLSPAVKNTLMVVAGLLAALGPALLVFGKIVSVGASAIKMFGTLAKGVQFLNAAMRANPILAIVGLIVMLIGVLVVAYQKSETFRNIVDGAFHGIKVAIEAVGNAGVWLWENALKPAFDGIMTAVGWIKDRWDDTVTGFTTGVDWIVSAAGSVLDWFGKVWDFFKSLPGKIGDAFGKVRDIILAPFKWAFNAIASAWNNTLGKINFTLPDWIPGIGGKSFGLPTIAEWKENGGAVHAGKPYIVGEKGPELFSPNTAGTIVPNYRAQPMLKQVIPQQSTIPYQPGSAAPARRDDEGSNIVIPVHLDGKVITEVVYKHTRDRVARR